MKTYRIKTPKVMAFQVTLEVFNADPPNEHIKRGLVYDPLNKTISIPYGECVRSVAGLGDWLVCEINGGWFTESDMGFKEKYEEQADE